MSTLELLADEIDGRLHAAVVRKGMLDNLYVDHRDMTGCWASLYLGKVIKVDPKLDAAFVDLGGGLTGFLPAKHVYLEGADSSERRTGIAELLKAGQMLLVQIKAEGKRFSWSENAKLPRLTTKLYVFGQCLVYSPTSNQVTISRHITSENVLKATARLKGKGGWLVQAAADHASEDDILFEAKALQEEWQRIHAMRETGDNKPRLLRAGPNAVQRALGDYSAFAFSHIHVANKPLLDMVAGWSARHYPALAESKRLRLFRPVQPNEKLFDMHDVYSELAVLTDAAVALNSGGSIIIEQTQALLVVDVNQGASGSAAMANQEAAREIARQTRLRNLGGAILIDFINMNLRSERARLVETLEEVYAADTAGSEVHGFTRLGIIEVTRKRRGATLAEKMRE